MGMVDGGFHRFLEADAMVDRTVGTTIAFLRRIQQSEFQGIHAHLLGQFVDDALRRKSCIGTARGPVGPSLGLVDQNVVTVNPHVRVLIGRQDDPGPCTHGRSGNGSGLVDQRGFAGSEAAVAGGSHLDLDHRTRGRTGGLQHFRARHGDLHGPTATHAGEHSRRQIRVAGELAAKAAANLHGRHLDLGQLQLQ